MNKIIMTETCLNEITLEQARNKPIFIVCKSTKRVLGMISHHYTDEKKFRGDRWAASIGRGGLVGLHSTLDECIKATDYYGKYIFVTDLNLKDFK